jgi:hypothetical protein
MDPVSVEDTFYGKCLPALATSMVDVGVMLNGSAAGGDGVQSTLTTSGCGTSRVM